MAMMPNDANVFDQLGVLASPASWQIIGVLAEHKPDPVPVHVITDKLGIKQSTASMRLRRMRNARLIRLGDVGYVADTAQIRSVIGADSYTRITQDLRARNEDTPR